MNKNRVIFGALVFKQFAPDDVCSVVEKYLAYVSVCSVQDASRYREVYARDIHGALVGGKVQNHHIEECRGIVIPVHDRLFGPS